VPVEYLDALPVSSDEDLLALDDALNDLYRTDARQAKIVDMKFFGGLSLRGVRGAGPVARYVDVIGRRHARGCIAK